MSPETEAPQQAAPEQLLVMGRVSGIFGIGGWIRVFSYTTPRSNILTYSPWYLNRAGQWDRRELLDGRSHGKGILARIEGCGDRDQAAELMASTIAVHRSQLAPTRPGEFYWNDLKGLRVDNADGVELGRIDHLFETGSNDVIVVKGDLDAGLMLVDWEADF